MLKDKDIAKRLVEDYRYTPSSPEKFESIKKEISALYPAPLTFTAYLIDDRINLDIRCMTPREGFRDYIDESRQQVRDIIKKHYTSIPIGVSFTDYKGKHTGNTFINCTVNDNYYRFGYAIEEAFKGQKPALDTASAFLTYLDEALTKISLEQEERQRQEA